MPGTIIKQYRELRNYSQQYVAGKMGMSQNAYSKIENNITQLAVTHVKQIATILDVPIMELLKDEYEIRKPHHLTTDHVTKTEIVMYLDDLEKTIKAKKADEHVLYGAVLAILQTATYVAEGID
jgi:transcriptional regulator with XRE-family HTH domain